MRGLNIVSQPAGSVKSINNPLGTKKFWTFAHALVYTRVAEQHLGANHRNTSTL
jgi:hypothetical protein